MEKFLTLLPLDEQSCLAFLGQKNSIGRLCTICERVEVYAGGGKPIAAQCEAYKFQLCVYLIQNELSLAKYLWKRLYVGLKDPQSLLKPPQSSKSSNGGAVPNELMDPIVDDDRIVEAVAEDREHRGQDTQIELDMPTITKTPARDQRGRAATATTAPGANRIAEAKRDVDQDRQRRVEQRPQPVACAAPSPRADPRSRRAARSCLARSRSRIDLLHR